MYKGLILLSFLLSAASGSDDFVKLEWDIPTFIKAPDRSETIRKFSKLKPLSNATPRKINYLKDIPGPASFSRLDENPDSRFYRTPRYVQHIDDTAIKVLKKFYSKSLKNESNVLDLCSSWVSHFPVYSVFSNAIGVGLNERELRRNDRLTEYRIIDLNEKKLKNPLSFLENRSLDAVLCAVSIDYLIRPVTIFKEVCRLLQPGGKFIISFSNRMFPTKAIKAWRETPDHYHIDIVVRYFHASSIECWERINVYDLFGTESRKGKDPLFVIEGIKKSL